MPRLPKSKQLSLNRIHLCSSLHYHRYHHSKRQIYVTNLNALARFAFSSLRTLNNYLQPYVKHFTSSKPQPHHSAMTIETFDLSRSSFEVSVDDNSLGQQHSTEATDNSYQELPGLEWFSTDIAADLDAHPHIHNDSDCLIGQVGFSMYDYSSITAGSVLVKSSLQSRPISGAFWSLPLYIRRHLQSSYKAPYLKYSILAGNAFLPKRLIMEGTSSPQSRCYTSIYDFEQVDAGEDAFFVYTDNSSFSFGVADGVGGWNNFGINPALFAWQLMKNVHCFSEKGGMKPRAVLDEAYDTLVNSQDVTGGSSTACILSIDKSTGYLVSANIGDSAYVLFRWECVTQGSVDSFRLKAIYRSKEKQHFFNAPFQLSIVPENIPQFHRNLFIQDKVSDSEIGNFGPLHHGDIIVVGTDGLFDNVFVDEIAALLTEELSDVIGFLAYAPEADECSLNSYSTAASNPDSSTSDIENSHGKSNIQLADQKNERQEFDLEQIVQERIQSAAEAVVREASIFSRSDRLSPFGKEARNHGWSNHFGGKVDDVTVLTAVVLAGKRPN